jgi:hypothetical protein
MDGGRMQRNLLKARYISATSAAALPVMRPAEGEPAVQDWDVVSLQWVVDKLSKTGTPCFSGKRPLLVAIDGRGGSGKSTLAGQLLAVLPNSDVVHTDDVAWHHSFFGWSELLRHNVLDPLRHGCGVEFRPAAWDAHRRAGSISIPAARDVVFIEGTGSSRKVLSPFLDASVWVQSDQEETARRLIARDGVDEERFHREWEREEVPFLNEDQPWIRATLIIAGTTICSDVPEGHITVATSRF